MITLSPTQTQEDLAFWLNQDREHNYFFMGGFTDAMLKKGAERLFQAYDKALRRGNLRQALAIVPAAQTYKHQALARIQSNAGAYGYIWPSFVQHTGREIETMLARVQGRLRSREEVCHGDRMLAEHAAFAASLLDPVEEVPLANVARDASNRTLQLAARCATDNLGTIIALSKVAGAELDAFVKGPLGAAKSIIHPVLANHVRREGERFMHTLDNLPNDEP